MRASSRNRFTVFDMLEAKGAFSSNPANSDSTDPTEGTSLYSGPVEFPKMFYHPDGEVRVLVPGEVLLDRDGQPRIGRNGEEIILGRQTEIIWQIATTSAEAKKLIAAGWHDHPAKAIAAAGGEAPPISSEQRIGDLERQLAETQAELDRARAPAAVVRKKGSSSLAGLPEQEQQLA